MLCIDVPPPLMLPPPSGFSIKDLEDLLDACRHNDPGPTPPPPPTVEHFPKLTPPMAKRYTPPQLRQQPRQPMPVILVPTGMRMHLCLLLGHHLSYCLIFLIIVHCSDHCLLLSFISYFIEPSTLRLSYINPLCITLRYLECKKAV
jgi:hypothetical protein